MTLKPDLNAGLSTGVKCWLFLMIALFSLGYSAPLSIVLGAIGGLAGGFVESCLKAKPDESPAKADKTVDRPQPAIDSSAVRKNPHRYGFGFGKMRTRRQQGTQRRFDLFFFRRRK